MTKKSHSLSSNKFNSFIKTKFVGLRPWVVYKPKLQCTIVIKKMQVIDIAIKERHLQNQVKNKKSIA